MAFPAWDYSPWAQHYFDWHHTRTDTVDKINPQEFRQCIAAMAVMGFVLADMPERLGE